MSAARDLLLVESSSDLKRSLTKQLYGDGRNTGYILLNYTDKGKISKRELQKILLSIGKRRIRSIPVILSVPNAYSEFIRGGETATRVSYPQNPLSRAFVMLAMAILVMPFFNFPYMQIPLGSGSALNDPGAVAFLLFLYSLILIFSDRKNISGKHYATVSIAVILFILPWLLNLFFFSQIVIGRSQPQTFSILDQVILRNPNSISGILKVYFPVLLKTASFAVFPLSFVAKPTRKFLYASYIISAVLFYLMVNLLSGFTFSSNFIPQPASFQIQFPPLAVYVTEYGDKLIDAMAGIPSAAVFFSVYLAVSTELKSRFSIPVAETSRNTAEAREV